MIERRCSIAQAGPKAKKRCVGGREVINRFSECSSKREVKVFEMIRQPGGGRQVIRCVDS